MITIKASSCDVYEVQVESIHYTVVYKNGKWTVNNRPHALSEAQQACCIELCQHYRHYVAAGFFITDGLQS